MTLVASEQITADGVPEQHVDDTQFQPVDIVDAVFEETYTAYVTNARRIWAKYAAKKSSKWSGWIPEVPEVGGEGRTKADLLKTLADKLREALEAREETWDKQLEDDIKAGKLDYLREEALEEINREDLKMKLGVMSDSHDNMPNIKRAVALFNEIGVDLVVHAGDFIAPFAIDPLADLNCRVVGVFGNNDGERVILAQRFESIGEVHPNLASVSLGGKHIAVMHYPELAIPIAKSGDYDIVVYGHTHKIAIRNEKSLLLNPGETGGWTTGKATVAVVDVETLGVTIHAL